ncbi:class A beta-lactamase [Actinoalloteichus hymeniacidonis]|uniref:Beta-lactamase class A n=1 Tax=Actinoalloteichus hymeniacidonis TaxID=340345 RepID=A0AAC9HN04_9PSEU|nr:class A beta-lactamase [Actinoalloteichus hymeniacidonis]AOS62352.1 beta-lactamase class A [Actinoalloteichus hymeniacidonis]MBB5909620.1 beta-lactamase class A [Actinoalloteichus hymeniacidonis]
MTTKPVGAVTRRAVLGAAALFSLAGCGGDELIGAVTSSSPGDPPGEPDPSTPSSAPAPTEVSRRHDRLLELEREFDARLGVYAIAVGTGNTVSHRADERFAFCSAFKGLAAAAVLHRHPMSYLDTVVTYTEADLMASSAITEQHVATGMTIGALCDAAVRFSDGTAGNLLLRDIGGPAELTAYTRSLGDTVTRMDRYEPTIVEATPGDPRDTTSPRAIGTDYHDIVLGAALPAEKRDFLRDLLERNATLAGEQRIRAGLPAGWTVADKTGTGDYGTANDIGIVWPPDAEPIAIAIMSSKDERDARYDNALLAAATEYVVDMLA